MGVSASRTGNSRKMVNLRPIFVANNQEYYIHETVHRCATVTSGGQVEGLVKYRGIHMLCNEDVSFCCLPVVQYFDVYVYCWCSMCMCEVDSFVGCVWSILSDRVCSLRRCALAALGGAPFRVPRLNRV